MVEEKDWCCTQIADVELRSLKKSFGALVAVDNLSLAVDRGEFITLLGPSGSGKTTTLMMIAGFEAPSSGDILIGGESVISKPPSKRNLGMVFQNYSLFPHMTVFENIAFPLRMRRAKEWEIAEKVKKALALVQLPDYGHRYPRQLSGGQQQRIALSRALVFDPPILLMDEPLGALDKNLREHMQMEIKWIQRQLGITTIYVTHDQQEALTLSNRISVMNHGRIEQVGRPEEIYERPANLFVAGFVGESNLLRGKVAERDENGWLIRTDSNLAVRVDAADSLRLGKEVTVAVRPERVLFPQGTEGPDRLNVFEGVAVESTYVGEVIKYVIRLKTDETIVVKKPNTAGVLKYERGEKVKIGWYWKDGNILEVP
jgi:spermidine/putrescine ABC transporter ATP-binding subunit